ncbi:formate dehydrogenase subunit delta [Bordetella petrii]|uniref:formate dehydrogenase subunit delta n=1 Tax=Bordetella petrii TaxID=94624 RepID=UPI001E5A93A5|nr:formate dehydrogenase subunit delta [Bordetella petrii]MCD0505072.1 formate dehydrogenase subunit delta [Bordetella petrii]
MDIANLIRMANRIGDFFDALPDRAEALEGVAGHIHKFWEPRMRHALLDFLAAHPDGQDGDVRLHEIVREAVAANRQRLTPAQPA